MPVQYQLIDATKTVPPACMIMYEPANAACNVDDRVDLQYVTLLHLLCKQPNKTSNVRAGRLMLDCSLSQYIKLLPNTEQMRLNAVLVP